MISAGFLAAALASVADQERVEWAYFAGGLTLGAAGVAVVRTGHRRLHKEQGRLTENIRIIETALGNIVANVTRLNEQKESIDTYDVRHKIEELFPEDVGRFVEARQSIGYLYGLEAYGDVMTSFAAGERYLNRVWSASADGYIDEVNRYIDKAREQFVDSLEKIRKLKV